MTSTTRTQNKYDHRLRELVRSTGDADYAIQLGVPRSTARGWVKSMPAEVVTLDIVDMDNVRLQQQVLRLQSPCGGEIETTFKRFHHSNLNQVSSPHLGRRLYLGST